MAAKRHFLGTDRPALVATIDWLLARYRERSQLKLANIAIVVPGSRAGRRLSELLAQRVEQERVVYIPPRITTMGRLPELLYEPQHPFAEELTQKLAWSHALKATPRDRLRTVVPSLPDENEDQEWLELASLFRQQHRELAGDNLNFRKVVSESDDMLDMAEQLRWQVMSEVQQRYLDKLDSLGMWDRQTARLEAIKRRECHFDGEIVLVGTVDMNRTAREMLDQLKAEVTPLVFGPVTWAERFDQYGCVDPVAWKDATIPIDESQLRVVGGPKDQALAVVDALDELQGQYATNEITIGLPDEAMLSTVRRCLDQFEIPSRWGPGTPVTETAVYQLLSATAMYLDTRRYSEFAAIVRHKEVIRWLNSFDSLGNPSHEGGFLAALDEYYQEHLPAVLGRAWPRDARRAPVVRAVFEALESLLAVLQTGNRDLASWSQRIRTFLATIYGDVEYDMDDPDQRTELAVFQHVVTSLEALKAVPEEFSTENLSAADVMRIVMQALRSKSVPPPVSDEAVNLLGWLELTLDDAPVAIVTSLNEGVVPKSVNSDMFLPDTLRGQLGLDDNARRYARDAYALSVILASRRQVRLIVGRRTSQGDPMLPSRLVLMDDALTVARRALRLFSEPADSSEPPASIRTLGAGREVCHTGMEIPRPEPLDEPIDRLTTTAFKDYLACPYRFYLRHVLKLKKCADDGREMDARQFGSLLHDVLRLFGSSPAKDSSDEAEIRETLNSALDELASERFVRGSLVATAIQREQLRLRLNEFSKVQARIRNEGWRIRHVEGTHNQIEVDFPVDGKSFYLVGRIDRVDVNENTGMARVLDYKTGETVDKPERSHQGATDGAWSDLQLPLYRHLAAKLGFQAVELGYLAIPKDTAKIEFQQAKWSDAILEQADETARGVIRNLRNEVFWPPSKEIAPRFDDYAAICRSRIPKVG